MDPDQLPLRDIHLPEPVPWWPPAPGWWVLGAVLVACAGAGWWWWRHRERRRMRRTAARELDAIMAAFDRDGDRDACARALSRLARRVALRCHGPAAAAATDDAWLELLAELGGAPPGALGRVLGDAPYSPRAAAALDAADFRDAAAAMRRWIETASNRMPQPGGVG